MNFMPNKYLPKILLSVVWHYHEETSHQGSKHKFCIYEEKAMLTNQNQNSIDVVFNIRTIEIEMLTPY